MNKKLEIIAFTIDACCNAQTAGADRIELCDNYYEGGTTPSLGFIKKARQVLNVELFPMIRHRGGDFLYSDAEFELMLDDVRHCKSLGCDGVVAGFLCADSSVDKTRSKRFVALAYPMETTFHRAFDRTADPHKSLEDIIDCGFTRILTSGHAPVVLDGLDQVCGLLQIAAGRIIIMPGSGIRSDNLHKVVTKTGATEFHSSARQMLPSRMRFTNSAIGDNTQSPGVDIVEVQKMREILNRHE